MKTVCASSVLYGKEAFETLGEVVVLADNEISPYVLQDADALIVRSKTRVDQKLLEDTNVSFVGTATAGMDHFDTDYLNHALIAYSAAPGCNANSVSEYVIAALLNLSDRFGIVLDGMTMGVVGVGEVGSRVVQKAVALGMKVLRNDPPLELATCDPDFVSLYDMLEESDIVTLHVPLIDKGHFPTRKLANCHFFANVKPGAIFINTSRGEVMDSDMLYHAIKHEAISRAVLDVWENEPMISRELMDVVDIATPHIAGHSFEGRLNGTLAVYREACHFFETEPTWEPDETLFPKAPEVTIGQHNGLSDETVLLDIVRSAYRINEDDQQLRNAAELDDAAFSKTFVNLRRKYHPRREFTAVNVHTNDAEPELIQKIAALGFQIAAF